MTDNLDLEVRYTCPRCGLIDVCVGVRFREEAESVVKYVQEVVLLAIGQDHHHRSPRCSAPTVDLKIPLPTGTEGIGMRPVDA